MGFRPKLDENGKPFESVDELPPWRQLIPLGLQHVLALYAGAVAVPLVVGGALIAAGKLNPDDLGYLVTADLFVAGIATLIQSIGFKWFGVRMPLMQGCTFAAVSPMIVIGSQYGVGAIYGSVIACGIFMMVLAPFFVAAVDLFALCRRQRIGLGGAARSLRTRLFFWLFVGLGRGHYCGGPIRAGSVPLPSGRTKRAALHAKNCAVENVMMTTTCAR